MSNQAEVETVDTQRKETTMSDLSGKTTIVVGASRGPGRGIATAFAEAGASVVAVARTAAALGELANGAGRIPAGGRRCQRRDGRGQPPRALGDGGRHSGGRRKPAPYRSLLLEQTRGRGSE
jgi:NAD(P)-dependent dehydrogenase (short-subunit alcohol dehydrogenase family)